GGVADCVRAGYGRHVFAGVLGDALPRLGDERLALAEERRAGGARLRARGLLAGQDAVGAHDALAHARDRLRPLVLRHAERTRHHAVAAAHALVGVVRDRTFLMLDERADGADRDAGRIEAVHAELAHVLLAAVGVGDVGELVIRGALLLADGVGVGVLVLLGARLLALLAVDAERGVVEDRFGHGALRLL